MSEKKNVLKDKSFSFAISIIITTKINNKNRS